MSPPKNKELAKEIISIVKQKTTAKLQESKTEQSSNTETININNDSPESNDEPQQNNGNILKSITELLKKVSSLIESNNKSSSKRSQNMETLLEEIKNIASSVQSISKSLGSDSSKDSNGIKLSQENIKNLVSELNTSVFNEFLKELKSINEKLTANGQKPNIDSNNEQYISTLNDLLREYVQRISNLEIINPEIFDANIAALPELIETNTGALNKKVDLLSKAESLLSDLSDQYAKTPEQQQQSKQNDQLTEEKVKNLIEQSNSTLSSKITEQFNSRLNSLKDQVKEFKSNNPFEKFNEDFFKQMNLNALNSVIRKFEPYVIRR